MADVAKFTNAVQNPQIALQEKSEPVTYKTYTYRWLILVLFFLVSIGSAIQWPMYVIIDNVMEKYYGTTLDTVNWTATTFLLCYVVFIYPWTYLLEKWGLKVAVLVAASGPLIASLLKLLSVNPDRFWVLLLAQTIIGATQTYITFLPASIAAAWFGPNQVSTACSIASTGMQVALAAGCFLPTTLLDGVLSKELIEGNLMKLNIGLAIYCGVVLGLVVLFYKADPPTAPSETRLNLKQANTDLKQAVKLMVKDGPFMLFWLGFSAHIGILYTLCFLLNPTILLYYPSNTSDIGTMGLLFISVGVLGCAAFGIILDAFHRFKGTAVLVQILSSISMLVYTITLNKGITYVYVFQTCIGFFMTAAVPVGMQVGAEITYPLPESVSSGMLLIGTKVFGFVFTTTFSYLFSSGLGTWTHYSMTAIVVLSTILIAFIPFELKRQAVNKKSQNKEIM